MCKFRDLTADEIECRVKKVTEKGAIVLLYKTARCDYSILDEVVKPEYWQCEYREVKGNMYCTIRVWNDELKQWISKENCGIESREDDEGNEKKGEASDAFKRAGFAWGIGRKLYTAPFIFIPASGVEIKKDGNRCYTYDTFSVKEIEYDEKKITRLSIVNNKSNAVVFQWSDKHPATVLPTPEVTPAPAAPTPPPAPAITSLPADVCPRCKKRVPTSYSNKLKKNLTGPEVIAAFGGMCSTCYYKAKEEATKAQGQ